MRHAQLNKEVWLVDDGACRVRFSASHRWIGIPSRHIIIRMLDKAERAPIIGGFISSRTNAPGVAMNFNETAILLALVATAAATAPASAGGVGGCSNLDDVSRAQGALSGMTSSCDMSVEQARRILAAQGGAPAVLPQAAPAPHHRVRKTRVPQQS